MNSFLQNGWLVGTALLFTRHAAVSSCITAKKITKQIFLLKEKKMLYLVKCPSIIKKSCKLRFLPVRDNGYDHVSLNNPQITGNIMFHYNRELNLLYSLLQYFIESDH